MRTALSTTNLTVAAGSARCGFDSTPQAGDGRIFRYAARPACAPAGAVFFGSDFGHFPVGERAPCFGGLPREGAGDLQLRTDLLLDFVGVELLDRAVTAVACAHLCVAGDPADAAGGCAALVATGAGDAGCCTVAVADGFEHHAIATHTANQLIIDWDWTGSRRFSDASMNRTHQLKNGFHLPH